MPKKSLQTEFAFERMKKRNEKQANGARNGDPTTGYFLPGQEDPRTAGFMTPPQTMYSGLSFPAKYFPGGQEPKNPEGRAGMEYVPQYFRQYPQLAALNLDSEINALKIYKQRSHVYGRQIDFKFSNMIMADPPHVNIYESDGETVDDELTSWMHTMMKAINLNSKVGMSWSDAYMWYGMSVFNPIMEWNDGLLELKELNRLPAHLFDVAPADVSWAYSQILQGIVYNPYLKEQGKETIFGLPHNLEFWQRQNPFILTPTKLDETNLFWVRNPNSAEVAGEPIMKPLLPILDMITFFWNKEVQRGNRVGSGTVFFEPVEGHNFEPANERNGQVSDMDYLNMIGQNWGSDNVYVTRRSFKLNEKALELNRMMSTVLPTIYELWRVLVDSMTPGSFVTKEGTLLGANGKSSENAFDRYVDAVRATLSDSWSPLPQYLLDQNGYGSDSAGNGERCIARIEFPVSAADRSDIEQKWGLAAPAIRLFEPNEVRGWAHCSPKTAEELEAISNYWARVNPVPGTQGLAGVDGAGVPGVHQTPGIPVPESIVNLINRFGDPPVAQKRNRNMKLSNIGRYVDAEIT